MPPSIQHKFCLRSSSVDLEEESNHVDTTMTAAQKNTTAALAAPVTEAGATTAATHCCKPDEVQWNAICQSSKFVSKGCHRKEIIIEPPAGFDGSEGTHQAFFNNDNTVFVLKIAPNPVLNNPHAINLHCANECRIVTADDSARDQAFKASATSVADKWCAFRHQLDWKEKPSDDLGRWWTDCADVDVKARSHPLLVIQLSSIKPVEVKNQKSSGALRKKTFLAPDRVSVKGKNNEEDKLNKIIGMLQELFPMMSDEAKKSVAEKHRLTMEEVKSGITPEDKLSICSGNGSPNGKRTCPGSQK